MMEVYIVREMSRSDDPASEGPELKRFKSWEEAKGYRDELHSQDGTKSYISEDNDA
jgi:hypothetical protein